MRASLTSTHPRRRRDGFTLVELITVVVIVGILAAIAIPTFGSYVYKSRTSEAVQFLGTIRLREEAFRSEFGQYCNTAQATTCTTPATDLTGFATDTNYAPPQGSYTGARSNPALGKEAREWVGGTPWNELGARPGGDVRFSYMVAAGLPATAAGLNMGWTAATADFWWIARAIADLDGDGVQVTFETYSAGSRIWIGSGNDSLDTGWE
jgi:type IV pilus assembly protein PilE